MVWWTDTITKATKIIYMQQHSWINWDDLNILQQLAFSKTIPKLGKNCQVKHDVLHS